jgi:hypothetical protein
MLIAIAAVTAFAAARTPVYPSGVRTGRPLVDRYLAAMERQDVGAIADLVQYHKLPCTNTKPPGYTWIKCKPGEAEGTLVDTFWMGSCDAGSVRADEIKIDEVVASFVKSDRKPYAVYRSTRPSVTRRGGYGLIFAQGAPAYQGASTLILSARGGLTGIAFQHCADTPAEVWAHSTGVVVLPPRQR